MVNDLSGENEMPYIISSSIKPEWKYVLLTSLVVNAKYNLSQLWLNEPFSKSVSQNFPEKELPSISSITNSFSYISEPGVGLKSMIQTPSTLSKSKFVLKDDSEWAVIFAAIKVNDGKNMVCSISFLITIK